MLWFVGAVCSLSAGLFHQRVSNYRRGSRGSVGVRAPPQPLAIAVFPFTHWPQTERCPVLPSLEGYRFGAPGPSPEGPVVFLRKPFFGTKNPHARSSREQGPINRVQKRRSNLLMPTQINSSRFLLAALPLGSVADALRLILVTTPPASGTACLAFSVTFDGNSISPYSVGCLWIRLSHACLASALAIGAAGGSQ